MISNLLLEQSDFLFNNCFIDLNNNSNLFVGELNKKDAKQFIKYFNNKQTNKIANKAINNCEYTIEFQFNYCKNTKTIELILIDTMNYDDKAIYQQTIDKQQLIDLFNTLDCQKSIDNEKYYNIFQYKFIANYKLLINLLK